MSRDAPPVVVIEAPGKIRLIESLLRSIGFAYASVVATRGRLFDLPQTRLGINLEHLDAPEWVAVDAHLVERLKRTLARAEWMVLLTDDDDEGELIASQVAAIAPHLEFTRIRCSALTEQALREALRGPGEIDRERLRAVVARRQLDRLIGYGLSQRERVERSSPGTNGSVGRVLTPLLASIQTEPLRRATAMLEIGGGWHAEFTLRADCHDSEISAFAAQRLALPQAPAQAIPLPCAPWRYEDAVLAIGRGTRSPLTQIDQSIQRLYESGRVSYPRTDSSRLAPESVMEMARLASALGLQGEFDPDYLARASTEGGGAHEAIHPADARSLPAIARECSLSIDERVHAMISARTLAAGRPAQRIREVAPAEGGRILGRSESKLLREMEFDPKIRRSKVRTPFFDEDGAPITPSRRVHGAAVFDHTCEEAVFERLASLGIARPSTLVGHVRGVVETYMNQEQFTLNGRGIEACHRAQILAPALARAEVAREIREALDAEGSVAERIERALRLADLDPKEVIGSRSRRPAVPMLGKTKDY